MGGDDCGTWDGCGEKKGESTPTYNEGTTLARSAVAAPLTWSVTIQAGEAHGYGADLLRGDGHKGPQAFSHSGGHDCTEFGAEQVWDWPGINPERARTKTSSGDEPLSELIQLWFWVQTATDSNKIKGNTNKGAGKTQPPGAVLQHHRSASYISLRPLLLPGEGGRGDRGGESKV